MEPGLKEESALFGLIQWVKRLQLSVGVCVCVCSQQNKRAGIDMSASESCWMCLSVDFHHTKD